MPAAHAEWGQFILNLLGSNSASKCAFRFNPLICLQIDPQDDNYISLRGRQAVRISFNGPGVDGDPRVDGGAAGRHRT